ncbi:MAG: hypothetical protein V4795_16595 [Pseudomonadota bacterium]
MSNQPDDRVAAGPAQCMRLVLGGRVEIEREVVRLFAQLRFDQARFDELMCQLDSPSTRDLRVVASGGPLHPGPHDD